MRGIRHAVKRGARVINLSLGNPTFTPEEVESINNVIKEANEAGVLVVAAAGNSGGASPELPAAAPLALAVGALDQNGTKLRADSNKAGPIERAYVVAPGTNNLTTEMNGGTIFFSQTSSATPFVSGLAALLFEADPNLTPEEVMKIIVDSADFAAVKG